MSKELKAQDLRIGNLVNVEIGRDILPVCVSGISSGSIAFDVLPNEKEWKSGRREIIVTKPIPLTEDWLVKFGFEKRGIDKFSIKINPEQIHSSQIFTIDKQTYIALGDNKFEYWVVNGIPLYHLEHIHQLQNLYYALTQTELTLKENVQPAT